MNKRSLIIGIFVLIALAGGVVLWNGKNNQQEIKQQVKKEVVKQTQEQKTTQKQNGQEQNQKQEGNKEQEGSQEQGIKHLSPEEIEKLKKEKDLVWYEIPELNIKFLVTRDMLRELKYRIKKSDGMFENTQEIFAIFYNQSEVDYKKKYGVDCFDEEGGISCPNWMAISRFSSDYNERLKKEEPGWACKKDAIGQGKRRLLIKDGKYLVCYSFDPQAFNWSEGEYEDYLKTIEGKNFNMFLETTQKIK